ncbi:MAG: sulfotransferase [Gammaproteobacteria bacterium]|nr:sulfotransferase [Gammaproteobacteria bacterium]MDH3578544.1 sulfotransferase [Gammaproteobacteria bacterium]
MSKAEPSGDLQTALTQAAQLLSVDPVRAAAQATALLEQHADSISARHIKAAALRLQGKAVDALGVIEPLAARHGSDANILHEYALCLGATGNGDKAIEVLNEVVRLDPQHAAAWRALGDQLSAAGDDQGSRDAYDKHLAVSTRHPELVEAAEHLHKKQLAKAERLTRDVLKKDPADVVAIRLLAAIGLEVGQIDDTINLLERCLELAPGFHLARQNYAVALSRRQRFDDALTEVDKLLLAEPNNPNYRLLRGSYLVRKGDHAPALLLYEEFLQKYPQQSGAHMNYGHTLKTVGRLEESIAAYRTAIRLRPQTGEAYWSLANLKTFRFSDEDIADMQAQVDEENGDPDDQGHLLFALGKAMEDRKHFDESFQYYARGNAIRSKHHRHNAKTNVFDTVRQIKTLDGAFFEQRKGWGCTAPDPIFIVGLPRAGSTLLEQILASHSRVEGTSELPDIIAISRRLGKKSRKNPASDYPEILETLSADRARELGEGYLESTRVRRHGPPFFIDKMPNNFQHVGLIHMILPNAKIIDARRHPMAGGFSCFKQLFAHGQTFTYNLTDFGYYYRDYVRLMDHWDDVLPGRVHRVQYEDMVADTENQIRRLLEYCELEFEEQCLRFYETERAIRTPSSEQVRQPVYKEGIEQWRNFEPWLGPLKEALGPLLDRYPID